MGTDIGGSLTTGHIVVLDFESTGVVAGYTDEPWQLGWTLIRDWKWQHEESGESLIRVGERPFNLHAPGRYRDVMDQIHGAATLPSMFPEIRELLEGRILCAHNISTEQRHLRKAFPFHEFGPWIDTLALSRAVYPDSPDHSLETVLRYLGLEERLRRVFPERDYHDALFDAGASALILEDIFYRFPDIDLETLTDPDMRGYYQMRGGQRR